MFKAMFPMKIATSEGANKLYTNSERIAYTSPVARFSWVP